MPLSFSLLPARRSPSSPSAPLAVSNAKVSHGPHLPPRARAVLVAFVTLCGFVTLLSTGCATRAMHVSVQGLVEDVEAGDRASLTRSTFDTQVVAPLGRSVDIRAEGPNEGNLVLRITSAVVDAGTALLELEVVRLEGGREVVLARPRVKAPLGEKTVAEARATEDDPLLRYFRFALEPRLEP